MKAATEVAKEVGAESDVHPKNLTTSWKDRWLDEAGDGAVFEAHFVEARVVEFVGVGVHVGE